MFSGGNPVATIDLGGLEPTAVNKGTDALILVLQGYGGDPPDNSTQAANAYAATNRPAFKPDGVLNGGIFADDFTWVNIAPVRRFRQWEKEYIYQGGEAL